jgi:hypothetical protein
LVRCPFCRGLIGFELQAANIWFVRPEARLAS